MVAETKIKPNTKKTAVSAKKSPGVAKKETKPASVKSGGEFAVIETGGKQYLISEGDTIKIEKLPGKYKEGGKVTFDKVLLVDNGTDTALGDPYIKGAKVEAVFQKEGKGPKVVIIRFKAKSRYTKKKGHRQPYVEVKIAKIT